MTTSESVFPGDTPNMFSVDVEEWYHMNFPSMPKELTDGPSRCSGPTEELLDLLDLNGSKATFFFLGSVAQKYPDLVRKVHARGHEVASHGYAHKLVQDQTPKQFAADVKTSLDILQDIGGVAVEGYRAPSWSLSASTSWAYAILAELGLSYSSSVFPLSTYLYGDSTASIEPTVIETNPGRLYEIPCSVLRIGGLRLPFSGGFYLRLLPIWAVAGATKLINRQGRSVVFYVHPREIDPDHPRLPLPFRDRMAAYLNLRTTARKLERLLAIFPTTTICSFVHNLAPVR
jgi:polysaccharide deacetylase family protein (PEP-CTERM system associated)